MPFGNVAAYKVKAEFMIDLLEEQITNIERLGSTFWNQGTGIIRDKDFTAFLCLFQRIEFI